jgi:type II secretion system protein N
VRDIPFKKIWKWAGYPVFFLLCFVFFVYKTFPYDRLGDRLVEMAAAQGYEVEIVDLTHSGLTGLEFENLRVVLPTEDDSPPLDVIFDQLEVGTSFLSLVSNTKSYDFEAELAGGEIDGQFTTGDDRTEVDVEVENLTLEAIPALRKYTKVPVAGTMNAEIEIAMPADVEESSGDVDVSIEGLNLGDGKTKIDIPGWGGLTLDRADAGNLELVATIQDGTATIERGKAHGADLKLDLVGSAKLQRPMSRSSIKAMMRVKIEEAYKARSPKVATMFELASSGLKSAMTPDGAIQYAFTGALEGRMRPRPAGGESFEAPK